MDDSPASAPRIDPKRIDEYADRIVRRLSRHGFDAYLVGGCVRDLLLGHTPKDFDLATSARPRQVKRLFRNSRIIGRRFRLVHIHFGQHVLEVATFRAPPVNDDEEDLYIRRDNVFGTERQDAFRRDFTINGLFYDVEAERVIDHVGGLPDLESKRIRMIGDPDLRLREDPVRILRAAKFAGRLGFELTEELTAACHSHCPDLEKSAPPRILEEIYRLLSNHGSPHAFRLLDDLGAIEVLLPEIRPLDDAFFESLRRLEQATGGSRGALPQSTLLGVLFWPVVRERLAAADTTDLEAVVEEAIHPLATRLTLARRDLSRARQCLATQARFLHEPRGRGPRRFAHRDYFPEAMHLRELVGPLRPDSDETFAQWRELAKEATAEAGTRPPRRRRRRRGGRKRGLSKKAQRGKDGECLSESSSAPAPPTPPKESPPNS